MYANLKEKLLNKFDYEEYHTNIKSKMIPLCKTMNSIKQTVVVNAKPILEEMSIVVPNEMPKTLDDSTLEEVYNPNAIANMLNANSCNQVVDNVESYILQDNNFEIIINKLIQDDSLIEKYILSNKSIVDRIILDYLKTIQSNKVPNIINKNSSIALTPFKKPKNLSDAKKIVDEYYGV